MHKKICLLILSAAFCGCALLKEPGPKLTAEQKVIRDEIFADWIERGKTAVMRDRSFGYDPESFKASACHGTGLFEKYELDSFTEGNYTSGTLAYYCPPENQYWINQHGGATAYYNRWAGPFPYKAAQASSGSKK